MKKIIRIVVVLMMITLLSACDLDDYSTTTQTQKKANEKNAKNVIENTPVPIIERSLERENLAKRAKFINQPNRVGYLYLLTNNGQLIREEQVQGKVSSLNSYLTPMDEYYTNGAVLQSPDIDGTWGDNQQGIFWFTPEAVYREWTGLYLFSSERLDFDVKPILIRKGE
ncbi:MAG: hypothetical protein Q4A42_02875 [Tissierellia bacterium]|nr:hypothetical protein [Tissierellia bacterium]